MVGVSVTVAVTLAVVDTVEVAVTVAVVDVVGVMVGVPDVLGEAVADCEDEGVGVA